MLSEEITAAYPPHMERAREHYISYSLKILTKPLLSLPLHTADLAILHHIQIAVEREEESIVSSQKCKPPELETNNG